MVKTGVTGYESHDGIAKQYKLESVVRKQTL